MKADAAPHPIDLAEEAAFRIGDLEVRPATLEVVSADGAHETLEPRVMQVLVALCERRGEVVSRDTLNDLCWGGRVVGDDALQRCISRLRKLGRAHAAFDIENVRGVGLRLVEPGAATRGRLASRPWLRAALAASLVVLAVGAVVGWRALSPTARQSPTVAVERFRVIGQDPAAGEVAARVTEDVRGVLTDNLFGASVRDPPRGQRADMTLGGTVARDGDGWRVRAALTDRSGVILWSREYARPLAEEGRLRDQVIVGASESVVSALEVLRQPVKLDPETLALYVRTTELATTGDPVRPGTSQQGLEQVLARAPTLGLARGNYAFRLVNAIDAAPPQERQQLRLQARREIDRAIRDSPHAGRAYDALYWLTRSWDAPGDYAAAEDVLLKGIAAAPDSAQIAMRECRLLGEVGREKAAVPYCERALALRPMSAPLSQPYATALYHAGSTDAAKQAIERAARFHPDYVMVRIGRFDISLLEGDFDEALRLLHSPETRPYGLSPTVVNALELLIEARRSGKPDDAERAIAAMRSAEKTDHMGPAYLVTGATQFGRLDDAFAALAPGERKLDNGFPTLFRADMAPLRKDPRFWEVAQRYGYLRYWRTRNIWPDFCQGPKAELDCPAAAARAGV
jgi:DNA-binding winged helix-turn-helix (wHTH) protein/tetratricopeptide (TPR) repeat protein/TolB-like protein